jgi:hypothetical protein
MDTDSMGDDELTEAYWNSPVIMKRKIAVGAVLLFALCGYACGKGVV